MKATGRPTKPQPTAIVSSPSLRAALVPLSRPVAVVRLIIELFPLHKCRVGGGSSGGLGDGSGVAVASENDAIFSGVCRPRVRAPLSRAPERRPKFRARPDLGS